MNQEEIWKYVTGYDEDYECSNLGNVRSQKFYRNKNLTLCTNKNGYSFCLLYNEGFRKLWKVHQLIAITFLLHDIKSKTLVIDHIDNNKLNNRLDNLQLITQRQNLSKDKKGLSKYTGVSWSKSSKKWKAQIRVNYKDIYLGLFDNELDSSKSYQEYLIKNSLK